MTLTNADILAASIALRSIVALPIPVREALSVARMARRISEAAADVEQIRALLVDRHAERDEAGAMVRPDADSVQLRDAEAFRREWAELMAAPVEIDAEPLRIEAWGDVAVAPEALIGLAPLLAEARAEVTA